MLGGKGGSPFDVRNRSVPRVAIHIMWIYWNNWNDASTLVIANNVCFLGVSMSMKVGR